jgi:hypothetical protein
MRHAAACSTRRGLPHATPVALNAMGDCSALRATRAKSRARREARSWVRFMGSGWRRPASNHGGVGMEHKEDGSVTSCELSGPAPKLNVGPGLPFPGANQVRRVISALRIFDFTVPSGMPVWLFLHGSAHHKASETIGGVPAPSASTPIATDGPSERLTTDHGSAACACAGRSGFVAWSLNRLIRTLPVRAGEHASIQRPVAAITKARQCSR